MKTSDNHRSIGIFDSGFGGLTVVEAVSRLLPAESIIYLGDTARLPYGSKSSATVINYTNKIVRYLLAKQVKFLVAACNTASAVALPQLQLTKTVPIMGVVEPGAQLAAQQTKTGTVAVLGTLSTIASGAYRIAIQRLRCGVTVHGIACPLLVPLVEEGWHSHAVTAQVVRHYLHELYKAAVDTDVIVLGCTHYPLLKDLIAREAERIFGHSLMVIDSAEAIAQAVAKELAARDLANLADKRHDPAPSRQFLFTDANRFREVGTRFLGSRIESSEHVDLDMVTQNIGMD